MTKPTDEIDDWTCKAGHKANVYVTNSGDRRCRTCRNTRARESYERNAKARLERNEAYRKSNWERIKAKTYARFDPVKHKARQAVNNAVKSGTFQKTDCDSCGAIKTEFHHTEGYEESKWFVGMWLCRPCHAKLHKELRWTKI